MNKKLIAVAVAAAFAAPVAMADVEVYGKAHVSAGQLDDGADGGDQLYVEPNNSNVGVRGSEDLGNGLKALYQMEVSVDWSGSDGDPLGGDGLGDLRDTYVGFGGDWGKFLVGRANTPYKNSTAAMDPFGDTFADYNGVMGISANDMAHDIRASNAFVYLSPDMNGFNVAGAWAWNDGLDAGDEDRDRQALSLSANYKQGPFAVAAAYQTLMDVTDLAAAGEYDDDVAMKIGGSYTFQENTTINAIYETIDPSTDADMDRDGFYVSATHKIGATTLGVGYAVANEAGDVEDSGAQLIQVGATHALSKATSVYALYGMVSYDDEDTGVYGLNRGSFVGFDAGAGETREDATGIMVGVIHNFSSK